MKVLYLTYDGLSDPLGQSQVLPYLIGLAKKHHEITIVSFEKKKNLALHLQTIETTLEENNINWVKFSYTKYPPVLSTLFDILKLRIKCNSLQRTNHFQIIHCRSYITSFAGIWLKKKYGLKFIFDMRGFYPDERVDGGLWRQDSLIYRIIYRFFKRKEIEFIRSADKIISLTNAAKKFITSNFSIPASRICIIPCCADTSLFDPEKIKPTDLVALRKKLMIDEKDFVLSYLGGLGTWYLLEQMLDFFKRLNQAYPSSKFLFITHHPEEEILNAADKINISRQYIRVVSGNRNEIPLLLMLSDLSIFFIVPSFSKMASSPTKQAEALAMGIPIICNTKIGDSEEIIKQTSSGLLIQDFTNEEYDQAISSIQDLLKKNKNKIRSCALDLFSLEKGVQLYQDIYNELKNQPFT